MVDRHAQVLERCDTVYQYLHFCSSFLAGQPCVPSLQDGWQHYHTPLETNTPSTLRQCKYLCSTHVSLKTKAQLAQALIISRVLYGANTLLMKATDIRRWDCFGQTIWRHLLNIKWHDRVTNDSLMKMIGDRWCLSRSNVMERKAVWLGHVIRHGGLAAAVVDGFQEGCRLSVS